MKTDGKSIDESAEYFAQLFGKSKESAEQYLIDSFLKVLTLALARKMLSEMPPEEAAEVREGLIKSWREALLELSKEQVEQHRRMCQSPLGSIFGKMVDPDAYQKAFEGSIQDTEVKIRQALA